MDIDMNKLDIIAPYYNEDLETIKRLLRSIQKQRNIDFHTIGIILVNDCSNHKISKKNLLEFPQLQITLTQTDKNVGPGMARQKGIDFSTAEYITFIDADDTYYAYDSLSQAIQLLNKKSPDLLLTDWMEELIEHNQKKNILHHSDVIFLHGKFIKREYLIRNDISFSPKLRLHEDSYFSTTLLLSTPNVLHSNIVTNYWRYRNSSLVRKQHQYHYLVRTLGELITSNKEVYTYLLQHNNSFQNEYAIKACSYLYYVLSSYLFSNKNDIYLQDLKKKYEEKMFYFLEECIQAFEQTPPQLAQRYMDEQRRNFLTNMPDLPFLETWTDFFTRIINTYATE